MALPTYAGPLERTWYYSYRVICAAIFIFLIVPIVVIVPLSFNAQPYFTFTKEMLSFDPDGYSLRWYEELLSSREWMRAIGNSFFIAISATIISTTLGTLAALGLSRPNMPAKGFITAVLISPMIVPLIITAAALFSFYARLDLANSYFSIIMAHVVLGTPFVVITVTASLSGFDQQLIRAAQSLGANQVTTFFKVILPLLLPGVVAGALFAFITSLDEVVVVLFLAGPEQVTMTVRMFSGLREEISPTILALATILVAISILLLSSMELLRRRSERQRGMSPG
ncbi:MULTISPECIES: ABC transporter permease [Afifella]|uniref:Putative spermidine/putrescine transport system permease protein n=1 Tax=Afifella marina DSM 2698 TaxID=1120955 RepID=A0A1G5NH24_AFIMA|nr:MULTISPECIES: ABC transporter permease [Afifella]MBK1623482.1 polyamine ABC transporter permease [Afifella marina DSM 2698]MBK1626475.1 polyamine ABC transporter permease [Afifella marina]MBK5916024.1 polyamine ABC transporter permease [Afifella marina]MCF1502972.1 ABC transporter permease [Afifella sp. H1R]RAI18368.1 polyamine ABC transporter permease [Afifella marina DSM 2698]